MDRSTSELLGAEGIGCWAACPEAGVSALAFRDLTVVAEASTSTDAVRLAREHRPDIAVLDLEMPPADGLRAAEEIHAELPTRLILVTRHARPGVLRRALAVGVRGFVPKTTPAASLVEIIRDVAAGRRYVDPHIAASALTEVDCPLAERELDVLRASRTGASISEIAAQVHLVPGTVRNYLSAAMTKLDVSSRHAAAHRVGGGLDLTRAAVSCSAGLVILYRRRVCERPATELGWFALWMCSVGGHASRS